MSETNEKQEIRKATRGFWKKILIGTALCLGALVFMAWISLFRDVPLEISRKTTILTEPLTADGKQVDYFRAIEMECYPPNMKTDENGFRMIFRAIGVSPDNKPGYTTTQTYEKLGLDPSIPPTMPFEEPYGFLQKYVESLPEDPEEELDDNEGDPVNELYEKLHRPWTLEEMPMMADWLKVNGPAIDLIVKAAQRPNFAIPKLRENEDGLISFSLVPEVHGARCLGRALIARAYYRIGTGDLDGASDDIIACKTIGRHLGYDGNLISSLVGLALEGMAGNVGIASSLEPPPTEAQLQRLLDIYLDTTGKKIPVRSSLEKAMRIERYMTLDMVQGLAHSDASERRKLLGASPLGYLFHYLGFDWNTVMEKVNEAYDHPEKLSGFNPKTLLTPKTLFPSDRSELLANGIGCMFISATEASVEAIRRAECIDRIKAITLAMLIYEKQHGTLPPAWTVDKEGTRLHSWRVLLLPYLGDDAKKLYEKIRLDEPWDSEHNRQFHEADVPFYQCPSAKLKPGETTYTVVIGKKTAFRGGEGVKLDTFGPNSANLLLVTERKDPACWMDPNSEVAETDAKTQIGCEHPGVIIVGFRSGSVTVILNAIVEGKASDQYDKKLGPDTFQKLLEGTAKEIP